MARVLDLCGLFDSYNQSPTTEEADAIAMYLDWRTTGEDISDAILEFQKDLSEAQNKQLPLFVK